MRPSASLGTVLFTVLIASGCSSSPSPSAVPVVDQTSTSMREATSAKIYSARAMAIGVSQPLCPPATAGPNVASCHILQRMDITPNPSTMLTAAGIAGFHPSDLLTAYGLSGSISRGGNQTVAVVVDGDNPTLELDLGVYRAAFGLPPCTVLNGCLRFVYHGLFKPQLNPAWAAEADLDVQMVSAICPRCKIVVAEAPNATIASLSAAVGDAVAAGATVVSNSYSIPENASDRAYEAAYDVPGIPMTAGAGDNGYGSGSAISFPAASRYVTAVGGTTLDMTGGTYRGEAVWGDTGSGCSRVFAKPKWQTDAGCPMRTINDLAVVGDPNTGVAAFVTLLGGWNVFGGTSVGAPVVASMYALAGNGTTAGGASLYAHASSFREIGGSSASCFPSYLCTAIRGYNGPAGLGTPDGLAAF